MKKTMILEWRQNIMVIIMATMDLYQILTLVQSKYYRKLELN